MLGLNKYATMNGKQVPLTAAPFISGKGVFYVNVRFISEASGASVGWDHHKKLVTITTSGTQPKGLTRKEIMAFDLLRPDWSKQQMDALGLTKEVAEQAGETYYSDAIITYAFLDFYHATTPGVVDIHGDHAGPRGIRIGDTFEHVMSLFPQYKDWRTNNEGLFYGKADPYKGNLIGLTGFVQTYEGDKEITLCTDNSYPFLRIFFKDDVVTHYMFFLINAD